MNWIILLSIEMVSIYLLFEGIRRRRAYPEEKIAVKDFFKSGSIRKTPGKVLIAEGLFGAVLGILLFFI